MMSASPKIFKIGYYKERIVIVERSNLGYFGGKPRHVTMIFRRLQNTFQAAQKLSNSKVDSGEFVMLSKFQRLARNVTFFCSN